MRDALPGQGPLVGIYSGLRASGDDRCVAVACDMPLLSVALLRHMLELAVGFDAVVLRVGGEIEPLHAVYSRGCLGIMEEMIERGELKVRDLLPRVRVRYVEEDEVDRFDPEHLSWLNVNTLEDLRRAEEIVLRHEHRANPYRLANEADHTTS